MPIGIFLTSSGMTGQVTAILEALYTYLLPRSIPPRAVVEFENGRRLVVDAMMKWEKAVR